MIPADPLGATQLLYLIFAWAFTFFSLAQMIPEMGVVEWVVQVGITLQAIVCTGLMLGFSQREVGTIVALPTSSRRKPIDHAWLVVAAIVFAVFMSGAGLVWKRALFGDVFAGGWRMDHIRFGPNNTNHEK